MSLLPIGRGFIEASTAEPAEQISGTAPAMWKSLGLGFTRSKKHKTVLATALHCIRVTRNDGYRTKDA